MRCSFVILTWNRKNFLEKCIPSLINNIRDKDNSEIIIMDNASNDGTVALLKELKKEYSHLKIIFNKKNTGLNGYKKLFLKAKGEIIIEVDDDVIDFPENIDLIFKDYFNVFSNFGYLALDVIQNEFTNGAKPSKEYYNEEIKNELIVEIGPTGGWCTGFRKKNFYNPKILFYFLFNKYNFKNGEDGFLQSLFQKKLNLKSGIIKNKKCFHASGPYYSKLFGSLERDIEKYTASGLDEFTDLYKKYK